MLPENVLIIITPNNQQNIALLTSDVLKIEKDSSFKFSIWEHTIKIYTKDTYSIEPLCIICRNISTFTEIEAIINSFLKNTEKRATFIVHLHERINPFEHVEVSINQENAIGFVEDEEDEIDNPQHYKTGGMETIEYIKAKSTQEEFLGFLKGNVTKYISRADHKNQRKKDLKKAKWYLKRWIKELENDAD